MVSNWNHSTGHQQVKRINYTSVPGGVKEQTSELCKGMPLSPLAASTHTHTHTHTCHTPVSFPSYSQCLAQRHWEYEEWVPRNYVSDERMLLLFNVHNVLICARSACAFWGVRLFSRGLCLANTHSTLTSGWLISHGDKGSNEASALLLLSFLLILRGLSQGFFRPSFGLRHSTSLSPSVWILCSFGQVFF